MKQLNALARAVIFDFDGTLLDTFPAIAAGWNAAMKPIFNRTYTDAEVISHFGPPDEGMIAHQLRDHPGEFEGAVERYFAAFERADCDIAIFPGIETLLNDLASRQIPLGIMTGKGRRAAEITLHRIGWHARFGAILTGDDVPNAKPAPDGLLATARAMNFTPRECVYIGDSPADMSAARAAKMTAVVAGWHGFFHDELRAMDYDFWAETPGNLGDWLRENVGVGGD